MGWEETIWHPFHVKLMMAHCHVQLSVSSCLRIHNRLWFWEFPFCVKDVALFKTKPSTNGPLQFGIGASKSRHSF